MNTRILFLEDEQTIGEVTQEYMLLQGYDVLWVKNGDEAKALLENEVFDLAILDIMVPGISGLDVLTFISEAKLHTPVIMLSALGDETTQVQAFNLFADDYIIKPFSPLLLLKRISAILRRNQNGHSAVVESQNTALRIDPKTYQAYFNNQSLHLTVTEYLFLQKLIDNPQQVFTREQLLEHVFPNDYYPNDRVVDAHIKNLRKKLPGKYIKTIIGVGYQFQEHYQEEE